MKYLLITLLLLSIVLSAQAELSKDDLNQIRLIIKEEIKAELMPIKTEITSMKADIVSLKESVARLDGRVDGIEKLITGLIVIIVALFGIPQLIVLWRTRNNGSLEKQIEIINQRLEILENGRIQSSQD